MPPERLDILRTAFLAMAPDKDYQAEASKIDQPVGAPLDGDAARRLMIDELAAAATPDVVAAYKRLAAAK